MSPPKPSLLRFKFEDFANLPAEPCKSVYSEEMNDCHGNSWKLLLQQGETSVEGGPFVGVYLVKLGGGSSRTIVTSFSLILRDANGKVFHEVVEKEHRFQGGDSCWGDTYFVKRSTILNKMNDILVRGALLIDAHLQIIPEPNSLYIPPSPILNKMLKLLEKGEGDVSFKLGDVVFTAHGLILRHNAPVLFNIFEEHNDGSPIPINDTTPEMFRIILRYVYGEEVPNTDVIKAKGKAIIDAANKFGVADLKIALETALVKALVIDLDNVADWLLFADAKTCPLLKEQAIAYFTSRTVDILNSDASKKLKESPRLLTELMLEGGAIANDDARFGDKQQFSVSDLRKKLHEKGLDVDGSKEMLICRLQESG